MPQNPFYVYALKDPRESPAKPFYIGKGLGSRAYDHLKDTSSTAKVDRIVAIEAEGLDVLVEILVDDLTEIQALKLEAELIAAFGTRGTGGILDNAVVPSGSSQPRSGNSTIVPTGTADRAQLGLALLKDAVFKFAKANPDGVRNADVANELGLKSDYGGGSKDYLSYSLLGLLMAEGRIDRVAKNLHVARGRST